MRYLYLMLCLCTLTIPLYGQESERIIPRSDTLSAADVPVDAVAFSPDGRWLVTGGRDGLVQVWETGTGDRVRVLFGHETWVSSLAFSPDASLLATGDRGGVVYIRQPDTGETQTVLTAHQADITGLAFSPDGTLLATGDQDGRISLYHIASQEIISQFKNYGGGVRELAFSPDGQTIVTGSEDGSIWLWGLWGDDAPWIKKLEGHTAAVTSLVFSSDGSQLFSGSLDATLRLWNLRQEATTITEAIQIMSAHQTAVTGAALLYDDRVAASISLDGTLRLWDVSPDPDDDSLMLTIKPDTLPLLHLANNARTQQLAISNTTGTITLYDVRSPMMATVLQQHQERLSQTVTVPETKTPPSVVENSVSVARANTVTATTPLPVPPVPPATPVIPAPAIVPTATPLTVAAAVAPPDPVVPITPIPPVLEGRSLAIPSVGIRSYVGTFPLDGISWAIDPWESAVGHFQGTAWFGQTGNIVLGGHSEYPDGTPGIFRSLYSVGIGDDIYVSDGSTQRRYVVVNIQRVDYRDLSVIYPTSHNRLTLITCDIPSYVQAQNIYYERLVIIADEVQ